VNSVIAVIAGGHVAISIVVSSLGFAFA
jgi:hypothetical protein